MSQQVSEVMQMGVQPPYQYAVPQEPNTKEQQISVNKSNIKVPVDIQDALEIVETLGPIDGTVAENIAMDKRGYAMMGIYATATAGKTHTYTVQYSYDNVVWITYYTSAAPEVTYSPAAFLHAARYWTLSSDAVAGVHNVTLIMGAVLG